MNDELSLRDFYTVFKRRRKEFFLCWVGIFAVAWAYTAMVTPLYRASVLLRVHQNQDDSNRADDLGPLAVLAGPSRQFDIDQLLAPQILEEGMRRLEGRNGALSERDLARSVQEISSQSSVQSSDKDPSMVTFSIVSPNGKRATNAANEIAEVMVEQVTADATAKAHKTKEFIESQLKDTEEKLRASEDRLRRFQEKFGPQSAGNLLVGRLIELRDKRSQLARKFTSSYPELQALNAEIQSIEKQIQQVPAQEIDIGRVAREVRLEEELFTMLTKRLEEARIVESARVEPIAILDPAIEPMHPEYPNRRFNLTAGFVLGFFLGLVIVLARQHLDTSMVTTEEIEAYLQLPVLATIPHIERRAAPAKEDVGGILRKRDRLGEARSRLIFHFPPRSAYAEVYHILRNNLMKGTAPHESRVFLFTSAIVAEGKSITAANFAIAAAQAGIPTLLAEADLRKPMVDKLFGIPPEPGVTNYFYLSPRWEAYLTGWEQIRKGSAGEGDVVNANGMANLHILPSGKIPPNPVSLLSSERFAQLIQSMRKRFPLVVLDGAPAMLFADSAILGPHVDGVVLVYRFGRTAREVLSRAHNQLTSNNARILGVVVNDIVQGSTQDNNYYEMYGYYGDGEKHARAG
ncbi:MAG TPA: polysaccharide biosynthesis tyrosine autokinase [Elusimicrobiota bacterium]|nr:polysaccharide biosynthesis tyrosine autokinase [Elusimicrobiota bacterium]